jgi:hypothetical protein
MPVKDDATAVTYQEMAAQAHREVEFAMQCGQLDHAAYLQHRRGLAAAWAMQHRDGEG